MKKIVIQIKLNHQIDKIREVQSKGAILKNVREEHKLTFKIHT